MTKEERSQCYTRSRSRPKSLQKIASSSQQLQKQQHQQQQRSYDILKEPSSSSRYNNNTSSKRNNNDRRRNHSRSTSPIRRSPINLIPTRSSATANNRGRRRSRSSSINPPSSTKRNSRSPITNIAANTRFNPKSKSRTSRSTSHSCSRSCIYQSQSTSRSTNHRSINNHHHYQRQPHHSRPRLNSPSHSRSPVPPPHHHHYHIHPPSDSKEIRSNSKLRFSHYLQQSSQFIKTNIAESEPILDNDDDESAEKKEKRRYLDSLNITPVPDSNHLSPNLSNTKQYKLENVTHLPKIIDTDTDISDIRIEIIKKACSETTVENSDATHNTNYPKSLRQKNVDTQPQINNRPTSGENNLSKVYSRNPRTPVQNNDISITYPSNSCIK